MSTLERPALPHQVLINLSGFITASLIECDRWPLALQLMAEVLPACPRLDAHDDGRLPLLEQLVRAAQGVVDAAPLRRDATRSMDWALAVSTLRGVVAEILWARACMAHSAFAPTP